MHKFLVSLIFIFSFYQLLAQGTLSSADGGFTSGNRNGQFNNRQNGDTTFKKRNDALDSITIYYRMYNQFKINTLDSNINNYNKKNPNPYYYQDNGNTVTATRSLLFSPNFNVGFGFGFHQYDVYNFNVENTKLYNTTKPFTELVYMISSGAEQLINITHTQNKKDNVNFGIEYKFINAPGMYKNQNSSLSNTRLTFQYQSPNKRFHLFALYISNKNESSENGGLQNPKLLDSLSFNNPFELQTRLGPNNLIRRSPFNTTIYTGNIYHENNIMIQSQYDLGQKDSLVKDSVTIKLFYPRLRLQHILQVKSNSYSFIDNYADSSSYQNYFNVGIRKKSDSILINDKWTVLSNEFSLISYPDKKNASQFLKAGAILDNISGTFTNKPSQTYYNISLIGEYRNRTKNRIWDIDANAKLFLNGFNAGDYKVEFNLKKTTKNNQGNLEIGFANINKTPEFLFNANSAFNTKNIGGFAKENTTRFWAEYFNRKLDITVNAQYFLMSNFLYFDSFFSPKQEATLFNVLQLSVEKKIHLFKNFNWYTNLHLQQATANAPINIPAVIAQNRFVFEGVFYRNLNLATGLEIRYISNYKPSGYSPFTGQFYYQNNFTLNNLPDIHLFFNFRIKSFKVYVRAENLNTIFSSGSRSYNFIMQNYTMQDSWMRLGIWWNFVN